MFQYEWKEREKLLTIMFTLCFSFYLCSFKKRQPLCLLDNFSSLLVTPLFALLCVYLLFTVLFIVQSIWYVCDMKEHMCILLFMYNSIAKYVWKVFIFSIIIYRIRFIGTEAVISSFYCNCWPAFCVFPIMFWQLHFLVVNHKL